MCFDIKTAPITALPYFCPFVIDEEEQYAWVDEFLQVQTTTNAYRPYNLTSQITKKKKEAYCKKSVAVRQYQNPGRNCKFNNECKSSVCYEGSCRGKAVDVSCYNHADCETGTYCNVLSYWPY